MTNATPSFLRLPEVQARTGLGKSTIYLRVAMQTFPAPVHLGAGARAVGWLSTEIDRWVEDQINLARAIPDQRTVVANAIPA